MGIQITDCDAEGSHFGISDWVGALRCDSAPSNEH
jgi:hypothetical protein